MIISVSLTWMNNAASKCLFPDHFHQPVPELLADRHLYITNMDVVIQYLIHLPDVDDIGIMDSGKGHRKLDLDIFQSPVCQHLESPGYDTHVFLPAFEEKYLIQKDLSQFGA